MGGVPVLTAYFASAEQLPGAEAFAAAAFATLASLAQRTLSTPVRLARRSAGDGHGAAAEIALKLLAAAMPLLAAALLLSRSD